MPPISVFAALADPTRCRILEMLLERTQPVHELAAAFSISRPAISRHLRVLRQAGLISETKAGRENRYMLHPERLAGVREWIDRLRPQARLAPDNPSPAGVASRRAKPAAVRQMGFDF